MASAESVAAVIEAGGAHVPELMERLEVRLGELARSHGPVLAEHAGSTIAAGGKRLRPLLVFVAAGPEPANRDLVLRAAVAVELVHSATLVHDDVLDAAPLRRGRPTVVATAGRAMATATGDLLFSRAFAELAGGGDAEAVRVLSDASSALAQGELLQREDAWDATISRERYEQRCDLKTARLFEAACRLGAIGGGGDADLLGRFGRSIGLAFQLLDDVLDVSGPAERTGKHRGTDLLDGTVTLPLILARERDPELAAVDLRSVRAPQQAERVCDAIAATGRWRSRARRRWRWSRRPRPASRRCRRPSRARSSWWPTGSSTATADMDVGLSSVQHERPALAGHSCWSRGRQAARVARRAVRLICADPGGRRTGFRLSARGLEASVAPEGLLIAESRMRWREVGPLPPPPRPTSCCRPSSVGGRDRPAEAGQLAARQRPRRSCDACRAGSRVAARCGAGVAGLAS